MTLLLLAHTSTPHVDRVGSVPVQLLPTWNKAIAYQIPWPRARPQTPFYKTLTSAKHKATGVFLKLFPLLACDSTLSPNNKLTLYKLMIRPILT
jgi:hypothetical protein